MVHKRLTEQKAPLLVGVDKMEDLEPLEKEIISTINDRKVLSSAGTDQKELKTVRENCSASWKG